jgi:hypothetical protein
MKNTLKENPTSTTKRKNKCDQNNDDTNIIKYMKKIEDIAKHACYCCKTLCFAFQMCLAFKLYFKKLPNKFKMKK